MYAEVYDVMADTPAPDKLGELKFEARNGRNAGRRSHLRSRRFRSRLRSRQIELGTTARMMRNQGPAGFSPAEFPFVEGKR